MKKGTKTFGTIRQQTRVVEMFCRGLTVKQMAKELGLGVRRTKAILGNVKAKTGLSDIGLGPVRTIPQLREHFYDH